MKTRYRAWLCVLVFGAGSIGLFVLQGCGGIKMPRRMQAPQEMSPPPPPVTASRPAQLQQEQTPQEQPKTVQVGEASWYGPGFHGKETSNGEIYDQNELTAAHPTLPEGSQVKVTNIETSKSVQLKVNDRGPHVEGRIIDVSKKAAEALEMTEEGVTKVKVKVLSRPDQSQNRDKENSGQKEEDAP